MTQARQMPVPISLPEGVFKRIQQAKDFVNEATNTLTESAQQARGSVTETAGKAVDTVTQVTDNAVDAVAVTAQKAVDSVATAKHESVDAIATTTKQAKTSLLETAQQTKSSLEQTLQTAQHISSTTSEAIQTGINSSVDRWLQAHPPVFRLVHLLLWAAEHPIISFVILLFAIAIAWSLIRAIGRLIDTVGWSLLQAPFRLSQVLMEVSWRFLGKFGGLAVKKMAVRTQPPLLNAVRPICDRQQRLAEIAVRLEVIQKEQHELLQEVAVILNSDEIDTKH